MLDLTCFGFTRLGVADFEFGKADFLAKRRSNYYQLSTVFGDYHMTVETGEYVGRWNARYVLNHFGGPETTEKELLDELVKNKMDDVASIYRKYKIDRLLA